MTTSPTYTTALTDLSKALQSLHKHLLEFQARQSFFTGSPLQLFDEAAKGQAFAWLRPLRAAIVSIDTRLADKTPVSSAEARAIAQNLNRMLQAKTGAFRDNLNAAFQHDPDTILAVGRARGSLGALHQSETQMT